MRNLSYVEIGLAALLTFASVLTQNFTFAGFADWFWFFLGVTAHAGLVLMFLHGFRLMFSYGRTFRRCCEEEEEEIETTAQSRSGVDMEEEEEDEEVETITHILLKNAYSTWADITEVWPSLWVGSVDNITWTLLQYLGISTVVVLTQDDQRCPLFHLPRPKDGRLHLFYMTDEPHVPIHYLFRFATDLLAEAYSRGTDLAILCQDGVSLSPTLAIAALLGTQGVQDNMNLNMCYHAVKNRRSVIHPNHGFFRQLIAAEKELFGGDASVWMVPVNNVPGGYLASVCVLDHCLTSITRLLTTWPYEDDSLTL